MRHCQIFKRTESRSLPGGSGVSGYFSPLREDVEVNCVSMVRGEMGEIGEGYAGGIGTSSYTSTYFISPARALSKYNKLTDLCSTDSLVPAIAPYLMRARECETGTSNTRGKMTEHLMPWYLEYLIGCGD